MAGIFAPTLQSNVSPVSATQTPSALGALANVGSDLAKGFFDAKKDRERETKAQERANQPSYTERKDAREAQLLSGYTQELSDLNAAADEKGWSPAELARRQNATRLNYLQLGAPISDPLFQTAEETLTGRSGEEFGMTDDQIMFEKLKETPEGQARIAEAALLVQTEGGDPTDFDSVADGLVEVERRKTRTARLVTDDTLTVRQAKTIFSETADSFIAETQTAYSALTSAGAQVSSEAIQERYLAFQGLEQQINAFISKNPNAEDNDIQDIKDYVLRGKKVFQALGVEFTDSYEFIQMSPAGLKNADKIKDLLSLLESSDEPEDAVFAAGIVDGSLMKDPVTWTLAKNRLKDLKGKAPVTPEWITENDIMVSNSLMGSFKNLVEYQTSPDRKFEKERDGALSMLDPEQTARWQSLTNEQGYETFLASTAAAKVFADTENLTPEQAKGLTNNLLMLSMSFETVDIESEAISFGGLRREVPANLPSYVEKLKKADSLQGTMVQETLYRSLTGQAFAYDKRVQSDESALNVAYDPTTNTYNFKEGDVSTQLLRKLVSEKYGNDVEKLRNSDFTGLRLEDVMPPEQAQKNRAILEEEARFSGGGMTAAQKEASMVATYVRGKLPDKDTLRSVVDMRSSSVFLKKIGLSLEPDAAKEERQAIEDARKVASDAVTTLEGEPAATVGEGSVTAQLIDQYEAGRGGYKTLFGQAQEEGNAFAGVDVTTMTLGELYEFSNPSGAKGTYGAYVKEANPEGVLATPMGRYQFVGKTLRATAKKMGLPEDTVFTPEVQDSMFLFLARDVTSGKSQEGKRKALRSTWAGFKNASDGQIDQMISEIENGDPNLGAGSFAASNARMTPEVTVTPLPDRGPQTQGSAPAAPVAPMGGTVGATGIPAEATLDPEIDRGSPESVGDAPAAPTEGTKDVVQAESLSQEVQGFLDNLEEDIPADKVQALLDYFGIKVDSEFGNMMANALSRGETEQGQKRKAEALEYFMNQLQR